MAIIKCKMCGGDLVLTEGSTIATCEYCGSRQTVPAQDNEKKLVLFERAERLRKNCEFDKAASVYESIVADFRQEAEAYWGLVLCKYGIEYVDDPATGKKIPTCHRSSFDSIMEDENFEQTLENADVVSRKVYREEAKQIEEIRKDIIAVSANEDPYDVFICYKEMDAEGNRTIDSVLAQDIYDALTNKGYRVFFSRISLEDKLGQKYEPYIFAALNSAKVMLAIGTDYEYFNAVWVKNEWSRFLKLIEEGKDKHLIPCFKGIDAYDMPKEFAKLQAQDLGKVGAIQDLIRGISKIIDVGAVTVTQTVGTTTVIVDTMLKRAADAISARDWEKAARCYDNVLDYDDKNEQAYIGRILINFQATSLTDLEVAGKSIAKDPNFLYLIQQGNESTAQKMQRLEEEIQKNIRQLKEKEAQLKKQKAVKKAKITAAVFTSIAVMVLGAFIVKNVLIPSSTYAKANSMVNKGQYDEAITVFASLDGFRDSKDRIWDTHLRKAESYAATGEYLTALEILEESGLLEMEYGDSGTRKLEYTYQYALEHYNNGDYQEAETWFSQIPNYSDSDQLRQECCRILGEISYEAGNYSEAISYLEKLGSYQDSDQRVLEIAYEAANVAFENGDYKTAISYYSYAGDYSDAAARTQEATYIAGMQSIDDQDYAQAVDYFSQVLEYNDAASQMHSAMYQYCDSTKDKPTQKTKDYIKELCDINYSGSSSLYKYIFAWKANVRAQVAFRIGMQSGVNFYAALSGGDGTSTTLRFVLSGNGEHHEFCDEVQYSAGDEATTCYSHAFQDVTGLTYSVKVYDDNGNLIGSFNGVPEPF